MYTAAASFPDVEVLRKALSLRHSVWTTATKSAYLQSIIDKWYDEEGLTNIQYDSVKVEAKKKKLLHFAQYAMNRGAFTEELKPNSAG